MYIYILKKSRWAGVTNTMATPAIRMFRRLEGLFCVYKPPGVHWKLTRDNIETNLLKGEIWYFFTYHKVPILNLNINTLQSYMC